MLLGGAREGLERPDKARPHTGQTVPTNQSIHRKESPHVPPQPPHDLKGWVFLPQNETEEPSPKRMSHFSEPHSKDLGPRIAKTLFGAFLRLRESSRTWLTLAS